MALELPGSHRATGLVDVLDRVLDKGLVIAGDIKVSLAEVELLTIRFRLLVCSHIAPGRPVRPVGCHSCRHRPLCRE